MSNGASAVFETLDLVDAVLLIVKGHRLSTIRPHNGSLLTFEFDTLSEQEASHILHSSDATLCRHFHRVLRDVRRQMDVVKLQGAGR